MDPVASARPAAHRPAPSPAVSALYEVSAALLATLPIVMVVAHRSSPLMLTLSATAALAGALLDDGPDLTVRNIGRPLGTALGASSLAFLAWMLLSIAWSPFRALSAFQAGEFLLPLAAGLVLAMTLPGRIDARRWGMAAMAGVVVAALMLVLDMASGLALRSRFGLRAAAYVLNRPALTLLVLMPPLVCVAVTLRRPLWAAAVAAATVGAVAVSFSGAAKFGLMAMVAVGLIAWVSRRTASWLVGAALLGSLAIAPILGIVSERLLPPRIYTTLASTHARERVEIWHSFGAAVARQPWIGAGVGVSTRLDQTPVAAQVEPQRRELLAVGHPHNAPLQIWTELGAAGAALVALVMVLLMRSFRALSDAAALAVPALVAAALAVTLVGQGAWQGWWPAGLGAAMVWFRVGRVAADRTRSAGP